VLAQVGLIDTAGLPVAGAEAARKAMDAASEAARKAMDAASEASNGLIERGGRKGSSAAA
jgi:hypothetical protein